MKLTSTRSLVPLTALLLTLGAGALQAAQLKVPQKYPTIQSALNAAQSGDVVLVSKGTYHENLFFHGIGVTLKGKGKVLVKPVTDLPVIQFHQSVDCKIVNIRVDGQLTSIGIKVNSVDNVLVKDCRIDHAGGIGIWAELGVGARLLNNVIKQTDGDAIRLRGSSATVKGNVIKDATADGIGVEGTLHTVEGNEIERATKVGIRLPTEESSQNLIVDNVIRDTAMIGIQTESLTVGNTLMGNRIEGSGSQAMIVYGKGQLVTGQQIKQSGSEGIFTNADLSSFKNNKVKKSGKSGIFLVSGSSIKVTGNKVRHSAMDGLSVYGSFHSVVQNSLKNSGQLDLNAVSTNTTYLGNDYVTTNLP